MEHNNREKRENISFDLSSESGRSFGEIALISEDAVRNASIISDEDTDLLVIHRDLYNQTLKVRSLKCKENRLKGEQMPYTL